MPRRGSIAPADRVASAVVPVLDENAWARLVWKTKEDISSRISTVQKIAHAIAGYRWLDVSIGAVAAGPPPERGPEAAETGNEALAHAPSPRRPAQRIPEMDGDIVDWAAEVETWARHLAGKPTPETGPTPERVLAITREAGELLGWTELLIVSYDRLVQAEEEEPSRPTPGRSLEKAPTTMPLNPGGDPPGIDPPDDPPNGAPPPRIPGGAHAASRRKEVLNRATTVVDTARDRLNAAQGDARNLVSRVGAFELKLLLLVLAVCFVAYALLHPQWGLYPLPMALRPLVEVFFWAIFGAVAISALTVAAETISGEFDPPRKFKYAYKIPLAPVVAYTLLLFFGLSGQALTGTSVAAISLEPATASYPVLILLSFLFGFFVKRSLDLLEGAWNTFFVRTAPAGETSEAGDKSSSTGGTSAGTIASPPP